jgi:RNA polymerase sigma factor (sigma-70 family)
MAFQARDPGAERLIFQRFFRPLCLYSERITGNMPAAEDVVAEAFEKCMDRRGEFKTLENCKAFLYHLVRNASINVSNLDRSHRSAHAKIGYIQEGEVEGAFPVENEILRSELLQEIYAEIEALPGRCRTIFKLIFFEGLSTEEIAERLGIRMQTVRSQKSRAIELIKTELLKKDRFLAVLVLLALVEGYGAAVR